MRIAISLLNFRPGRIGGTETYLRELVAHLPSVAGNDELVLVVDRDIASQFEDSGLEIVRVDTGARGIVCRRLLEAATRYRARSVERVFEQLVPDVALFPQQVIFPRYVPCPAVLVVHDLYHLYLPENLSQLQRWYRRTIYGESLQRADRIITVSNYTRCCLLEHYSLHDRADRIATVHHGYRPIAEPLPNPGEVSGGSEPFLYYPAVSHPHKNHLQLFHSVARLRAAGMFPYRLVLSGEQTSNWARLRREIRRLELDEVVCHLGFLPFAQVCDLYREATAVVFPSKYEGFGIPIVEAASLGKRLITSRLEVFRELGVPEPFRIDFDDPAALHRALESDRPNVLERPPQTWRETTRQTLEIVRQAVDDVESICVPFEQKIETREANARIARAA